MHDTDSAKAQKIIEVADAVRCVLHSVGLDEFAEVQTGTNPLQGGYWMSTKCGSHETATRIQAAVAELPYKFESTPYGVQLIL